MPTYISLCRWMQQGSEKIKESPSRVDAAKKAFESLGVKLRDFYMRTGRYDMVIICDAPDEMAIATAMISVSSKVSIKTETVRAFSEDVYRKVVAALP